MPDIAGMLQRQVAEALANLPALNAAAITEQTAGVAAAPTPKLAPAPLTPTSAAAPPSPIAAPAAGAKRKRKLESFDVPLVCPAMLRFVLFIWGVGVACFLLRYYLLILIVYLIQGAV